MAQSPFQSEEDEERDNNGEGVAESKAKDKEEGKEMGEVGLWEGTAWTTILRGQVLMKLFPKSSAFLYLPNGLLFSQQDVLLTRLRSIPY